MGLQIGFIDKVRSLFNWGTPEIKTGGVSKGNSTNPAVVDDFITDGAAGGKGPDVRLKVIDQLLETAKGMTPSAAANGAKQIGHKVDVREEMWIGGINQRTGTSAMHYENETHAEAFYCEGLGYSTPQENDLRTADGSGFRRAGITVTESQDPGAAFSILRSVVGDAEKARLEEVLKGFRLEESHTKSIFDPKSGIGYDLVTIHPKGGRDVLRLVSKWSLGKSDDTATLWVPAGRAEGTEDVRRKSETELAKLAKLFEGPNNADPRPPAGNKGEVLSLSARVADGSDLKTLADAATKKILAFWKAQGKSQTTSFANLVAFGGVESNCYSRVSHGYFDNFAGGHVVAAIAEDRKAAAEEIAGKMTGTSVNFSTWDPKSGLHCNVEIIRPEASSKAMVLEYQWREKV
jgi:hypothetical protein